MKRYQTNHWDIKIEEIDVIRETDVFMILPQEGRRKERREAKESDYHLYHETWVAAHAYLLQRAKDRITSTKSEWERQINELKIIENMKEKNG